MNVNKNQVLACGEATRLNFREEGKGKLVSPGERIRQVLRKVLEDKKKFDRCYSLKVTNLKSVSILSLQKA